jgi:glycosyltransferase involved in cell wall biosynthesis
MKDMPPYYAAMDVLAFPTYREGLPNVPLEASAMGLPVVASNATGCVDVIDEGVTGTLVPVRDAAALAAGLDRYLSDPGLRERHGRAAREMVLRNFLPETIWAALHHEYLRLLRERGLDIPAATQQT